ncbi:hypothetical protein PAXRUDRAFT_385358 [Paxillus rubicundulus Ve08.2h10]|uniref:Uncharacterized protein n=1 Tax=Paxillus rubicundulus Ve08.2h10 TaxID=930991 RepID=A0A0D0E956_9AGAM|nr:hypothetical protein PAXRUDRAFT_385358 [Paxillus rubicundulus Ve08.2h10]
MDSATPHCLRLPLLYHKLLSSLVALFSRYNSCSIGYNTVHSSVYVLPYASAFSCMTGWITRCLHGLVRSCSGVPFTARLQLVSERRSVEKGNHSKKTDTRSQERSDVQAGEIQYYASQRGPDKPVYRRTQQDEKGSV